MCNATYSPPQASYSSRGTNHTHDLAHLLPSPKLDVEEPAVIEGLASIVFPAHHCQHRVRTVMEDSRQETGRVVTRASGRVDQGIARRGELGPELNVHTHTKKKQQDTLEKQTKILAIFAAYRLLKYMYVHVRQAKVRVYVNQDIYVVKLFS